MSSGRLHFPAKLYQIIESESPDIIRWHQNGKSFRIVDHSKFESYIIPKYFRHSQISSVQRQLNLYGFKCVSRGEHKGSFFHPKFIRGEYDAVRMIRRSVPTKTKKSIEDFDGLESFEKPSLDVDLSIAEAPVKDAAPQPAAVMAAPPPTYYYEPAFMPVYQDNYVPVNMNYAATSYTSAQPQMESWSQPQAQGWVPVGQYTSAQSAIPGIIPAAPAPACTMVSRPNLSQRFGFVQSEQLQQQPFVPAPVAVSPSSTTTQMTRPTSTDDLFEFLGSLGDICPDLHYPDVFDYDDAVKIEN